MGFTIVLTPQEPLYKLTLCRPSSMSLKQQEAKLRSHHDVCPSCMYTTVIILCAACHNKSEIYHRCKSIEGTILISCPMVSVVTPLMKITKYIKFSKNVFPACKNTNISRFCVVSRWTRWRYALAVYRSCSAVRTTGYFVCHLHGCFLPILPARSVLSLCWLSSQVWNITWDIDIKTIANRATRKTHTVFRPRR